MDRFELFRFFSRFQFLSRKFTSPRWRGKHLLPTYWMIRYDLYNCLFKLENLRGWQTNCYYLTSFFPSPKNAEEKSLVEWLDCKILCHMKIPQELFILWIRVCVGVRGQLPTVSGFPTPKASFQLKGKDVKKFVSAKVFTQFLGWMNEVAFILSEL